VRRITAEISEPTYRFPTLPGIAADVMRLANTAEVTFRDVDQVVRRDPIIAARVLSVANSSAFGPPDRVMSLRTAMMILGWTTVRDVLWQVVAEAHVFRSGLSRRYLQDLRLHAVTTAHVTRMLCRELNVDTEHAFVCGLLHDLGRPLALEIVAGEHGSTFDEVAQALDEVHTEVGARIAVVWNLPASVAEVAGHHHDYDTQRPLAPCSDEVPMSLVVAAADRIAQHHGPGPRQVPLSTSDPHTVTLFSRLGLTPADVEDLLRGSEQLRARIL
jgi:putative nucleotidyltransferase with HDIG domain